LCETRLILETATAGLAAERATAIELERMMQLVELRYTPGDRVTYAEYLKANSIFHRELARASHNTRLESMVMAVLDELQRPLYLGLDVGLDTENATREHVLLVEAIESRDPARARLLQSEQLTRAGERMIAAMRAHSLEGGKA
jgi:DNA-binding GntR family transcriptional regulator